MYRVNIKKLTYATLSGLFLTTPTSAQAYCIDHAILLCMRGGFPSNAVCNRAKATMIRRVVPNPNSEPPLQLWRCPLGVSYSAPSSFNKASPIQASFTQSKLQPRIWKAQSKTNPTDFDFVNELRVIYTNTLYYPETDNRPEQWITQIRICSNASTNCKVISPDETYSSEHFGKSVSFSRIMEKGVAILYWDNSGNPTLTNWFKY